MVRTTLSFLGTCFMFPDNQSLHPFSIRIPYHSRLDELRWDVWRWCFGFTEVWWSVQDEVDSIENVEGVDDVIHTSPGPHHSNRQVLAAGDPQSDTVAGGSFDEHGSTTSHHKCSLFWRKRDFFYKHRIFRCLHYSFVFLNFPSSLIQGSSLSRILPLLLYLLSPNFLWSDNFFPSLRPFPTISLKVFQVNIYLLPLLSAVVCESHCFVIHSHSTFILLPKSQLVHTLFCRLKPIQFWCGYMGRCHLSLHHCLYPCRPLLHRTFHNLTNFQLLKNFWILLVTLSLLVLNPRLQYPYQLLNHFHHYTVHHPFLYHQSFLISHSGLGNLFFLNFLVHPQIHILVIQLKPLIRILCQWLPQHL